MTSDLKLREMDLSAPSETSLDIICDGQRVTVGVTRLGTGPTVLMLPALSSISTRDEMRPLQEILAARFRTVAVDWPGFGTLPRPKVDWRPALYREFLRRVLGELVETPFATVAAGHAAGYALDAARGAALGRLCLVAPTWRGPLPTMANGDRPIFHRLGRLVDGIFGPALFTANVNWWTVGMMGRGHVYDDPHWLGAERLEAKLGVTRAAGARFASLRFVTGMLDPMRGRDAFLDAAAYAGEPILVVYGANTPRRSKAEMMALADLSNVRARELPVGKLAVHEEQPEAVGLAILQFLEDRPAQRPVGDDGIGQGGDA